MHRSTYGDKSTNKRNPLGSSVSCNCDSAEISRLNSKLDRFFENVTSTLQDHSAKINSIKENKPYSIDLNVDKERRTQEQTMNISHIISDLKMANKKLENDKSSLFSAIKLMQND